MGAAFPPMDGELPRHGETGRASRPRHVAAAAAPVLAPARYVRLPLFEALTGYSANAVEKKIQSGAWIDGREYKRAPDGHVLVDMRGYERWVEGQ
jgi:hypothetical protein